MLRALEGMIKAFIKNVSKEEKQDIMREFLNSMDDNEKTEMIQLLMPIIMKEIKPEIMLIANGRKLD